MRIAIVGSRNYKYLSLVEDYVKSLPKDTLVISGGAKGVDITAENTAKALGIEVLTYLPKWDLYGRAAGFYRNTYIAQGCDEVRAFWDGESSGTLDTMNKAFNIHKLVYVCSGPELKWEQYK